MFETLLGYFLGLIYGEYNNIFPFFICILVYTFLIISKNKKQNFIIDIFDKNDYINTFSILIIVCFFIIGFLNITFRNNYIENIYLEDQNIQKFKEVTKTYNFIPKDEKYGSSKFERIVFYDKSRAKVFKEEKKYWKNYYNYSESEVLGDGKYIIYIYSKKKNEYSNTYMAVLVFANSKKIRSIGNFYVRIISKEELDVGNYYSLNGKLVKYDLPRNYDGFNNILNSYTKRNYFMIGSTLKSFKKLEKKEIKKFEGIFMYFKRKYNDYIIFKRDMFNLLISKSSYKDILKGIVLSDTTEIEEKIKENFKKTNTYHILAVSGTHFGYLILIMKMIDYLFNFGKIGKSVLNILITLIFMSMIGFSSSVSRVGIILLIKEIFNLKNVKISFRNLLLFSFLIILILNPYKIADIGLYLSYGGVLGILFVNQLYGKNFIFEKLMYKMGLEKKRFWKKKKEIEKCDNNLKNASKNSKSSFLEKIFKKLFDVVVVSTGVQIIIFPIIAYFFGYINLNYMISNIFAIPILGIAIFLGMLVLIFGNIFLHFNIILNIILKIIDALIFISVKIITGISKIRIFNIYIPKPKYITIILYYFLIYLLFTYLKHIFTFKTFKIYVYCIFDLKKISKYEKYIKTGTWSNYLANIPIRNIMYSKTVSVNNIFKQIKKFYGKIYKNYIRVILCLIIAIIVSIGISYISDNSYNQISFVDIGQGDSSFIHTRDGKNILIDAGEGDSKKYSYGEKVLFPYLIAKNARKIDYLFITHFDSDHYGGALKIIDELKVKNLVIPYTEKKTKGYYNVINKAKERDVNIICGENGKNIICGKYFKSKIIWPDKSKYISENELNNNCLVMKITISNLKILYTGDIEKVAEEKLFENTKKLYFDIVKAAHHGSISSTTDKFLEKVKFDTYVISCGRLNKFGHPSDIVLEKVRKYNKGVKIRRTDKEGEIVFKVR